MTFTWSPSTWKLWLNGWAAACLAGAAFTSSAVATNTATTTAHSASTDRGDPGDDLSAGPAHGVGARSQAPWAQHNRPPPQHQTAAHRCDADDDHHQRHFDH